MSIDLPQGEPTPSPLAPSGLPIIHASRPTAPPSRRGGIGVMGWLLFTVLSSLVVVWLVGAVSLALSPGLDPATAELAADIGALYRDAAGNDDHAAAATNAEALGIYARKRGDLAGERRWRRAADLHRARARLGE